MRSFGVCLGVTILLIGTQAFAQGDSWEIKEPMPTARQGPTGGAIDGLFYYLERLIDDITRPRIGRSGR